MTDLQATFFATVVDEWVRAGVTDVVICPGNRSTLMAVQLSRRPELRLHTFVDERSAAFFALGMGMATGRPAVVWTTSGTAASELRAAVVEADLSRVPLIVATADRPPEQRHVRDWQSVDQSDLYGGHTRWSFDPGVADEAMRAHWRSIASRSVLETTRNPSGPGPVHLNLPIREPWSIDAGELPPGREGGAPWHVAVPIAQGLREVPQFKGARGVFCVGAGVDVSAVEEASVALGWPVLADVRSGAHGLTNGIAHADLLARSDRFRNENRPDVVVHLGQPMISKSVNQWLAEVPVQVVVGGDRWSGPGATATTFVDATPGAFCAAIATDAASAPKGWADAFKRASMAAAEAIQHNLDGSLTEPGIARVAMDDASFVFLATSMPVRDADTFTRPSGRSAVFANRGASGMDGLISTAAGIAALMRRPMTMVAGDLSFLYDLGALWNIDRDAINLTIVVIDNDGGGIFETIPRLAGLDRDVFERLVATPRRVDIPAIAASLGARVQRVASLQDLSAALADRRTLDGVDVIYAPVDRAASVAERKRLIAAAVAAVEG